MRRPLILAMLAVGMFLAIRKITGRAGPVMREHCSGVVERMSATMPESFPPNRMMADLDALKGQTARILEVLEQLQGIDGPQE